LLAGGSPQHFENRISCKDGSLRWLAWRAVLDRGQVYAVGRDVTNIRRTQEELHTLQRTLAYVSRDSTMGIMTASLAHEIKQPLAVIAASASAGLRWLNRAEPDLAEVQQCLAAIANEGQRIDDVISSIRAMFRKEEPDSVPLDIGSLAADILALVQGELHSKNIAVRNELPGELPLVIGKRVQLQQVLLNLIMNAIEAMSRVDERKRELTILTGQIDEKSLEIIVEDTGCGIDPADYERIFNTFYTTKQHGMGMGLFICRSIIETHRGRLWALPRSPFGTTFHLTLPRAD
jgi:signal transduction histidine kinase